MSHFGLIGVRTARMKNTFAGLMAGILIFSIAPTAFSSDFLPPFQETSAYRQYLKRPKTELSKILYLLDRFKDSSVKVVYDGQKYDAKYAAGEATKYIARNYKKKEQAESWIKIHAYRSQPDGDIIYLKYPDGKYRPLRDVLLEELSLLTQK